MPILRLAFRSDALPTELFRPNIDLAAAKLHSVVVAAKVKFSRTWPLWGQISASESLEILLSNILFCFIF